MWNNATCMPSCKCEEQMMMRCDLPGQPPATGFACWNNTGYCVPSCEMCHQQPQCGPGQYYCQAEQMCKPNGTSCGGGACGAGQYYCQAEQQCKPFGASCGGGPTCGPGQYYCDQEQQCKPYNSSCGCQGNTYYCYANGRCTPYGRQCCSSGTGRLLICQCRRVRFLRGC